MTDAEKTGVPAETPKETVERLSALARIHIPEERKEALAAEFAHIISYIGQLDELIIPGSEKDSGMPILPPLHNVLREDAYPNETGQWTEAIVKAFPSSSGTSLSVKKIISHD